MTHAGLTKVYPSSLQRCGHQGEPLWYWRLMERCHKLLALFPDGMGHKNYYFVVLDTAVPKVGP